ncbi:MAG: hypothetical protein ACK4TL_03680 [Hyphomicrobiaceae bacterium]
MYKLNTPRRLALIAVVLAGGLVGTLAAASPSAPMAQGASSTRYCATTFCTNRLWLRAPVLRTHAR